MKRPVGLAALLFAAVMLVWLSLPDTQYHSETVESPIDGTLVSAVGRVYRIEQRQSYGTSQLWIYLDSVSVITQQGTLNASDVSYHLLCVTDTSVRPPMGSRITVAGQIQYFSQATNPGQFDIAKYYDTVKIGARLQNGKILQVSEEYSSIREWLYQLSERWKSNLYQYFPSKEASILGAMLLGDKTQLDEEVETLYQQSGIVHILSISGLHISILGLGLYKVLRRLGCPVLPASLLGAVILILYGIMTGMSVSAIRAIGMYLIRMLGEVLGRTYDMLTALGIMLVIMLLDNPYYLENSGFWLSFGSVFGIGLLMPLLAATILELPGIKLPGIKQMAAAMLPGLCVSMVTLPVQLYFYHQIPSYSILLNLLILPFVEFIMIFGLLVMTLPGFAFTAGTVRLILLGYEWLCGLFLQMPGKIWNPGAPKPWQMAAYYTLFTLGLFMNRRRNKTGRKKFLCVLPFVAAILILGWNHTPPLTVTFLDVGQGDCIVVQTKEEAYVFDCGSTSKNKVGEKILIPFLKQQGISKLDAVFLSHADADHMNGIQELLELGEEGIIIEKLVLPDISKSLQEREFGDLLTMATKESLVQSVEEILYLSAGDSWQSGAVTFRCLHPKQDSYWTQANAYSLCFLVEDGEFSMLLTGDVEGVGEEYLLEALQENGIGTITVLKAAHHGSAYSTSESFLAYTKPALAVISCGEENPYGHPHKELLERLQVTGCHVYKTMDSGAITLQVKGDRIQVECFLGKDRRR